MGAVTQVVDHMVEREDFINNNHTKVMACLQLPHMTMLHPQQPVALELPRCMAVTAH